MLCQPLLFILLNIKRCFGSLDFLGFIYSASGRWLHFHLHRLMRGTSGALHSVCSINFSQRFSCDQISLVWRTCRLLKCSVINNLEKNLLILMLLVANFCITKWCKQAGKWLKPWQIGTHLRVLSESFPMNTNMTGFRLFSKIFVSLWFGRK